MVAQGMQEVEHQVETKKAVEAETVAEGIQAPSVHAGRNSQSYWESNWPTYEGQRFEALFTKSQRAR